MKKVFVFSVLILIFAVPFRAKDRKMIKLNNPYNTVQYRTQRQRVVPIYSNQTYPRVILPAYKPERGFFNNQFPPSNRSNQFDRKPFDLPASQIFIQPRNEKIQLDSYRESIFKK
jgi:hypothetical protein